MKIIDKENKISIIDLKQMAENRFGDLVKAVVDIEKGRLVVDAELHADEEQFLLENDSKQEYLWGINLYPEDMEENFIEFDSMINLRPSWGNRSRGVDDEKIREEIIQLINNVVEK